MKVRISAKGFETCNKTVTLARCLPSGSSSRRMQVVGGKLQVEGF